MSSHSKSKMSSTGSSRSTMSSSTSFGRELEKLRATRATKAASLDEAEFQSRSLHYRYGLHGKADDHAESLHATPHASELRRDIADIDERLARTELTSRDGSGSRAGSWYKGSSSASEAGTLGPEDSISQFGGSQRSEASRASKMGGGSQIAERSESGSRSGRSRAGSYADHSESASRSGRSDGVGSYARSPSMASRYYNDEASECPTVRPGRSSSNAGGYGYTAEVHTTTRVRYTTEIRVPPGVSASHSTSHSSYASGDYSSHASSSSFSSSYDDFPRESYTGRIREPGGFAGSYHPLGSSKYPELRPESDAGSGYSYRSSRRTESSTGGGYAGYESTNYSGRPSRHGSSAGSRSGSSASSSRRHGSSAGSESGFSTSSSQSGYTAREPRSDNFCPASLDPRSRPAQGSQSGSSRHDSPSIHRATGPSKEPPRSRCAESTYGSKARYDDTASHRSSHSRSFHREGAKSHHGKEAPRGQSRYEESSRGHDSSNSRAPPRSHASSAMPSQAEIDAWWASVNAAFKDYSTIQKFPAPPGGCCDRVGCQAKQSQRANAACEHVVKHCLKGVKSLQPRRDRLKFHEDRFAKPEHKQMANEVFICLQEMYESELKNVN